MSTDAATKIYQAYRETAKVDAHGEALPLLSQLKDGGAGWFGIVNAIDEIATPPKDTVEPYEAEFSTPIEKRIDDDGDEILEKLPTGFSIRPSIADDLCVPGFAKDTWGNEVLARATGIDLKTIEWRIDPADVESAKMLHSLSAGLDARWWCASTYAAAGGTQDLGDPFAWLEVARALLTEYQGDRATVQCRTPGVGTLTVGPLRAGHIRIYEGAVARSTEWDGRLKALAMATKTSEPAMRNLRVEDARNLWSAFDDLKKKVEDRTNSIIDARLSITSSPAGDPATSTTSP